MKNMFLGTSAAALLAASPAFAQSDPQAAEDEEEIVVTAQLREQDPVDVPFALTAYNGEFLEDLGIEEFEELSQFVPGFEVQNQSPNNPGFVMRGITSDSGQSFIEPRVSVFQDGVSISKSRGSYVELFDMERVEIAKGPQSTLYGRGAGAGRRLRGRPPARARARGLGADRPRPDRVLASADAEFDHRLPRVRQPRNLRRRRHFAPPAHRRRGCARRADQPGVSPNLRRRRRDHGLRGRVLFPRKGVAADPRPI